jgi:hypothetical protein
VLGINRESRVQSRPMREVSVGPSKVGSAIRAADLLKRAMFLSGRKRRREESLGQW